jgi:uncharacterized protein (TIGR02147 family)
MLNVFQYLNFRHYLRDFYLEKKAANSLYSYRVFNEQAGIRNPSFLKLVTEGKRNLSEDAIKQCVKAIKLGKREAQFFRLLVLFGQATTLEERNQVFRQISYFKEYNAVKNLDAHQYEFYSHWYNVALLELIKLKRFREDPEWIAIHLKPQITETQAIEALAVLKKLGLVKKDKALRLIPTDKNIATSPEVFEFAVRNFHETMIQRAKETLNDDGEFRDVSSVTIAVDQNGFNEAKRRIQEFRRELNVLLSGIKNPDQVYQINFQIFNLTGATWKSAND